MDNGFRRSPVVGAVALLLAACADSPAPGTAGSDPGTPGCSASVVAPFTADWTPLPAAAAITVTPEVQAARDRVLGPGATDPAQVRVWWYGVASFIAAVGGHLFLFDAWEVVGMHQDYVPIGREDLVALQPEAILVGHGHFDHAGDLGYVAARTGALVVAGEATCATAREQAARDSLQDAVRCLVLGDATTPEPGTVQHLRIWEDLPEIAVLRHTHSAADPSDLAAGGLPLIFVPDLLTYLLYLNTDAQEIRWFVESLDDEAGNTPDGGAWAYHLRVGDFSLLWHDSAGPIADGKPYAQAIRCALDSFPGCVDVQIGTIVGFGAVTSGLRDVRLYVEHAHPRVSLPNHHDAWAPIVGPGAVAYETQWREALAELPHPPALDYLRDPEDYLRVRSWHVDDPQWREPMPGSSCAR